MKRVITLLMAGMLVLGTAGLASAVEFKVSGHMHVLMGAQDNGSYDNSLGVFNKDEHEDNFYAAQRFRPKLTMSAEGVTAVFEAQQHNYLWGDNDRNGTGNAEADVRIRNAYIDFMIPGTPASLKVGFQQLSLPSIWGNPVFDNRVGGAVLTVPLTEQVAVAAFYARPNQNKNSVNYNNNSVDMGGLLLPMDFNTVKATPYFAYAKVGLDSGFISGAAIDDYADLLVGGINVEIAVSEALSIKFDGIVTNVSSDYKDAANNKPYDMGTGWMVGTAIDYQMPFGTPGFFGWYATGQDDDGEGALASVSTDGFGPTTLGMDGASSFWNAGWVANSGSSTWGVGLQIADMSFIDSLSHTIRVAYIQGTSDKDGPNNVRRYAYGTSGLDGYPMWSTKDNFIEVDFDSTWSIYENLAAVFELGVLIPDVDTADTAIDRDDTAYRGQVTFRFSF